MFLSAAEVPVGGCPERVGGCLQLDSLGVECSFASSRVWRVDSAKPKDSLEEAKEQSTLRRRGNV